MSDFETAHQCEDADRVLLQVPYAGELAPLILSRFEADIPCSELGPSNLLTKLNNLLDTSYTLETPGIHLLLSECINNCYDFGTTYARLRNYWGNSSILSLQDFTTLSQTLAEFEARDTEIRAKAQAGNTIVNPWRVPPRRLWDLFAHRVIPGSIAIGLGPPMYWPISHSWTDDMVGLDTPVNGHEWPVPIPTGVTLESVRNELLNLGAEYVWLDILCLRQRSGDPAKEALRAKEWAIDVPTIGNMYQHPSAAQRVQYCNGFGRAFSTEGWDGPRHWLNRAWTLQEISRDAVIGGVTLKHPDPMQARRSDGDCVSTLAEVMRPLNEILTSREDEVGTLYLFELLTEMKRRAATGTIDKIAGLSYLLRLKSMPAYYETSGVESAWALLVDQMSELTRSLLLFLFPCAGDADRKWMPSWKQIEQMDLLQLRGRWSFFGERVESGHGKAYYRGPFIPKCLIRGLNVPLSDMSSSQEDDSDINPPRFGEVVVEDSAGEGHTQRVWARHGYLIPDGYYTIVGNMEVESLVVCELHATHEKFLKKVSVIQTGEGLEGFGILRRNPHIFV
ncbi:hypothetical protein BDZ91DRAFT_851393 [Kalaharituber pfeilii]|nr:hypothetical protein BDZ91DRAFT_851393 [Kalaharituber pfeilii]